MTWNGKAKAGVKWWLLDAGTEVSRERAVTQTIKLTLDPVTLDQAGHIVQVFIDADDGSAAAAPTATGPSLDAVG